MASIHETWSMLETEGLELRLERVQLVVLSGDEKGRIFPLVQESQILGRGDDVDVKIEDGAVSRKHARIFPKKDGWQVEDLGSKSGTFLGGARVQFASVQPGDVLKIGRTELRFEIEIRSLGKARKDKVQIPGMVGSSAVMSRVFRLVRKLAPLELPVLIHGESGTGKEGLAQALHELSPRKDKALVVVDCTLLDRDHLRSELFGHVNPAYSRPHLDRK
jgi:hypothetical protein